jgi:hypothetical protein
MLIVGCPPPLFFPAVLEGGFMGFANLAELSPLPPTID